MVSRFIRYRIILKILTFSCSLWLFWTTSCVFAAKTDSQDFPLYPAVQKNVQFWEKIYAHYSLNQAVIHDSEDLSKIYEVIQLLDRKLPGAQRINSLAEQQTREKYVAILQKLVKQPPVTSDDKRVAALFPGKNSTQAMANAARNVRSQSGQKERFLEGVIASGAYMKEIKRIFRSYQLPEDLAYMAHVESSFNTRAYSKLGAAGIWQFTRATGMQYMTIDYMLDERLDPIRATYAAAKYLQNSYRSLNNWPLTITSYNYGLAGTVRAVNELGSYENIFRNYNKGYFKFASKNFYSEFLAALKVAKKLEASSDIKPAPELSCQYLNLPGYIDINEIARNYGLSVATLGELNPALLAPVLSGEKYIPKGYTLRLPADKNSNGQTASFNPKSFKNEQKASLYHRVQKGDTVSSIAKLHGVSSKSLMQANNLDKYATIFLRQNLRIPGKNQNTGAGEAVAKPKTVLTSTPKIKIASITTAPTLNPEKKNTAADSAKEPVPRKDPLAYNVFNSFAKDGKKYGFIVIQPEESLQLLAEWLGSNESTIAGLNKLKSDTQVSPGQKLLLAFDSLSPDEFINRRLDFLRETENEFLSAFAIIGRQTYRVNRGDTLWDICYNKFEIPLWLLERYNTTITQTQLQYDQKLIIPIIQAI